MSLLTAVDTLEFTEVDYTGATFDDVYASLESLTSAYIDNKDSSILRLIIVAFRKLIDIVLSMFVRTFVRLKGLTKSIDETSLQTVLNNNAVAYKRLSKANYDVIRKADVATFPFRVTPSEVTELITSSLNQLDGLKTVKQLTKPMREFISAFLSNDLSGCQSSIDTINAITMPEASSAIRKDMVAIVQKQLSGTHEKFGFRYSSMSMFDGIVKEVLVSSNVINDTMNVAKEGKKVEKLATNVQELVKKVSDKQSAEKLLLMAKSIRNIAEYLDCFATTVQEYHHLEHNMTNVLKVVLPK